MAENMTKAEEENFVEKGLEDVTNKGFTENLLWDSLHQHSETGHLVDLLKRRNSTTPEEETAVGDEETQLSMTTNGYTVMELKEMLVHQRLDSDQLEELDPANILKELIYDTLCSTLELPYLCVRIAQNAMILSGAGLCHLYLVKNGDEGKELWSPAHSISCEVLDEDPRKIELRNVVWDTKRGILGHVARTGEAIMIEKMSLHTEYDAEVDILAHDCGLLCLPIHSPANEMVGVIQLSVYGEPAFNNQHKTMVMEYLKFVAIELIRFQLYKTSQENVGGIEIKTLEGGKGKQGDNMLHLDSYLSIDSLQEIEKTEQMEVNDSDPSIDNKEDYSKVGHDVSCLDKVLDEISMDVSKVKDREDDECIKIEDVDVCNDSLCIEKEVDANSSQEVKIKILEGDKKDNVLHLDSYLPDSLQEIEKTEEMEVNDSDLSIDNKEEDPKVDDDVSCLDKVLDEISMDVSKVKDREDDECVKMEDVDVCNDGLCIENEVDANSPQEVKSNKECSLVLDTVNTETETEQAVEGNLGSWPKKKKSKIRVFMRKLRKKLNAIKLFRACIH